MNDNDSEINKFQNEYKSDKRRNGKISIAFGLLFLVWTGFDIALNFWGELWYVNVFFAILGVIFIVSGIYDSKKHRGSNDTKRD